MKVSVVLPAFNEDASVKAALESLGELYQGFEIILVNDGSTDRTGILASEVEGVTVLSHKRNLGYGASMKSGFRAAGGVVVVIKDADNQHETMDVGRIPEEMQDHDMVNPGFPSELQQACGRGGPLRYCHAALRNPYT